MAETELKTSTGGSTLKDVLELVLDKGIVIAGDIKIEIAGIELINIKIRLILCSVDKAMDMGINWWQQDAHLSSKARDLELQKEHEILKGKIAYLESKMK